jgi:hypothetical protein
MYIIKLFYSAIIKFLGIGYFALNPSNIRAPSTM